MKKVVITLLILAMAITLLGTVFENDHADSYFIDVKIGKSYQYNEMVKVESKESILVYNKANKEQEILDLNVNEILLTYFESGRVDVYNTDNALIYSMPGDGSVFLGTKSSVDAVLRIGGVRYRGYVTLINAKNGLYNVINHISVEKYLYGVLPKEFPTSAPIESIKAQAVTARGFSYSNINKHIAEGFNLCDTIHCQVYGGFDSENPNSNRAIDDTKGMVVTYNGTIAETLYHSNSGGHTENSENVWKSPKPYLVGVNDPFSLNTHSSTWSFSMNKNEMSQRLLANGIDVGLVNDMIVLNTFQSGRVSSLRIVGTTNQVEVTGANLRTMLGTTQLRSTLFTIDSGVVKSEDNLYVLSSSNSKVILPSDELSVMTINGGISIENRNVSILSASGIKKVNTSVESNSENIIFNGKGYGHGVGMSQFGAIEMAKQGSTYDQILKFYYSGIDVTIINR